MTTSSFGTFVEKNIFAKIKNNIQNESKCLKYFENNGYCDFRCGCDLCENGDAFGVKTNFDKIYSHNLFLLNNLDIIDENTWYDNKNNFTSKNNFTLNNDNDDNDILSIRKHSDMTIIKKMHRDEDANVLSVKLYNETSDAKIIKEVYSMYVKKMQLDDMVNFFDCDLFYPMNNTYVEKASCSITSIFYDRNKFSAIDNEDVKNISRIKLCNKCYKFLIYTHGIKIRKKFIENINPFKYAWIDIIKSYMLEFLDFANEDDKKLFL